MSDFWCWLSVARLCRRGSVISHTLVIVDDVSQVVATAVVGLAHTHRVVSEIDIAVIAWLRISLDSVRLAIERDLQKSG